MSAIRVWRFGLRVGWQEWASFWSWRTWLGGWMARMIAQAVFFALLGELLDSQERLRFLIIGNIVAIGVVSSWAVPASTWDRYDGTYPLLVVAPTSLLFPIIGRTSVWLLNSVASCLVTLVIVLLLFDLGLSLPRVLLSVPLLALGACGYYCMALLFGSLITRAPRFRNLVNNVAIGCILAFCGVNVSVDFWPAPIQAAANLVPVTHYLQAIRLLFDGGSSSEAVWSTFFGLMTMSVWLCLAFLTIDRMADSGRKDGSIEFV